MTEDAQREIEQRSLRNVRSLLDKLENEAAARRRTTKWIALGIATGALVLFGSVYFVARDKGESRTLVVQPAGRPPAAAAPIAK